MMAVAFDALRERCQFENTIYRYVPPIGAMRRVRRAIWRLPDRFAPRVGLGKPSRFAVGEWVRIADADAIRATLDARGALRGLAFTDAQFAYCGRTVRVASVVRRMMNDRGRMRAISRTVTLEGVMCDGPERNGGCGRACPLLFRDEWLEPAAAPSPEDSTSSNGSATQRFVRVKSLAAILGTLDRSGRRDGVMFSGAMGRYAGARLAVYKQVQPLASTWWRRSGADWFILEGARCLGEQLNSEGPCHRGCGLLWHPDWLEFED